MPSHGIKTTLRDRQSFCQNQTKQKRLALEYFRSTLSVVCSILKALKKPCSKVLNAKTVSIGNYQKIIPISLPLAMLPRLFFQ